MAPICFTAIAGEIRVHGRAEMIVAAIGGFNTSMTFDIEATSERGTFAVDQIEIVNCKIRRTPCGTARIDSMCESPERDAWMAATGSKIAAP